MHPGTQFFCSCLQTGLLQQDYADIGHSGATPADNQLKNSRSLLDA
jgi:hypothetical protein